MSWDAVEPEIRAVALRVCTPDQIDVLKLYSEGHGYRVIGRTLGISKDTARGRLEAATKRIREEVERGKQAVREDGPGGTAGVAGEGGGNGAA